MAGVKGRSGGARPNSGPKRKPSVRVDVDNDTKAPIPAGDMDMLKYLQDVALGRIETTPLQVRAAVAAVQYTHPKFGEGGKKEEKDAKAKKAGENAKFAAAPPPLRAVK